MLATYINALASLFSVFVLLCVSRFFLCLSVFLSLFVVSLFYFIFLSSFIFLCSSSSFIFFLPCVFLCLHGVSALSHLQYEHLCRAAGTFFQCPTALFQKASRKMLLHQAQQLLLCCRGAVDVVIFPTPVPRTGAVACGGQVRRWPCVICFAVRVKVVGAKLRSGARVVHVSSTSRSSW